MPSDMPHVTVSVMIMRNKLPPHTDRQLLEWLDYVTGNRSLGISCDNPLCDIDLRDAVLTGTLQVRR